MAINKADVNRIPYIHETDNLWKKAQKILYVNTSQPLGKFCGRYHCLIEIYRCSEFIYSAERIIRPVG